MEGAKVYAQDAAGAWQKATIVAALGGGRYRVQLEPWEGAEKQNAGGDFLEVDASSMEGASLPFQNSNMPENGFPNMTTLDHLHEAALLHNLRVRFFASSCPYTYTADIVIAVNPYRWFPHLYTEEQRKEYLVFDRAKLAPHVYATSSCAYSGLRETKLDQSILVSGESGAGKTETVKILMAHLALVASSDDSSHIKRIVESNPLLESFGNAQTVRNDNSSRFGKFIELQLNGSCCLSGSKCRTYLLEKSRVVGQDAGERNYHIFYQMLATPPETRAAFGLDGPSHTRDAMKYTSMGASKTDKIEGKPDSERFKDTVAALALVGVEGDSLSQLLSALAGVLLLGQVEFARDADNAGADDEAALRQGAEADVAAVAAQLQVDASRMESALTRRSIKTRNEVFVKPLNSASAYATRDAVAKELYARIFDWLVARICQATAAPVSASKHFVGLLDIFGFESFAINRFEQLCINYANEKLQQKFTLDVFKAVQQEYSEEGIPWDKIEFKDNAPVLALIESKMGIIAMLNEECVRPKGSDVNFVSKLTTVHKEDKAFSVPRVGKQKELQFTVRHYAGEVTYTTSGWLERNKDSISDDVVELMRSSGSSLVAGIFAETPADTSQAEPQKGSKAGSDTVATKFKSSLAQLMDTIGRTTTQYVRCIKPNKNKSPAEVDNVMVLEQLRCAGVIEAIRISRAGFPARMPLKEFAQRFGMLARASGRTAASGGSTDAVAQCRALLAALVPNDKERYEVGRTRVYFKTGVLESLEERRALIYQAKATEITRRVRGRQVQQRYILMRLAAIHLQASQRMRIQRASYLSICTAAITCQSARRQVLAKRRACHLRREQAATRMQAFHRGRVALRTFRRARKAVIHVQSVARRRACRRQYLIDLAESKEQAKLENQVKALQAKLEAQERAFKEAQERREHQSPSSPTVASTHVAPEAAPAQVIAPAAPSGPSVELLEALNALTAENAKLRADNERQRAEITVLKRENQQLRAGQTVNRAWFTSMSKSSGGKQGASGGKVERQDDRSRRMSSEMITDGTNGRLTPATSSRDNSSEGHGRHSNAKLTPRLSLMDPSIAQFWADVPFEGLTHLSTSSEIHVKIGPNILMVDDKNLVWRQRGPGYRRSMALLIERRDPGERSPGPECDDLDASVGGFFALKSTLTGKYVALEKGYLRVSCSRPEDASVFMFVPPLSFRRQRSGGARRTANGDGGPELDEYSCALRLLDESHDSITNKVLSLRNDGFVSVTAIRDENFRYETMAATIEYLRPLASYDVAVKEEQIGVLLERDLPLRVAGFKATCTPGGHPGPGPAERTGRVHIGDIITRVNGQNISGIPRGDVLEMIACKRPVTLGFSNQQRDHKSSVVSPPPEKKSYAQRRSSISQLFTRRTKAADEGITEI